MKPHNNSPISLSCGKRGAHRDDSDRNCSVRGNLVTTENNRVFSFDVEVQSCEREGADRSSWDETHEKTGDVDELDHSFSVFHRKGWKAGKLHQPQKRCRPFDRWELAHCERSQINECFQKLSIKKFNEQLINWLTFIPLPTNFPISFPRSFQNV